MYRGKSYLQLHIATILFGFSAIFGGLIDMPALSMVWWRVFLTSLSLIFFIDRRSGILTLSRKTFFSMVTNGWLVGLHWLCFYGTIKIANVSVALLTFAASPLFTAVLEPLVMKKKVSPLEIILGLLIVPCMVFVSFSIESGMLPGILLGLVSMSLFSIFSVFNKKIIHQVDPITMTFVELSSAWLLLGMILLVGSRMFDTGVFFPPHGIDWVFLLALSIGCTTIAFVLSLKALRYVSAYESNLIINLEPLYGILLAAIIFKEYQHLNMGFYVGGGFLLGMVLAFPYLKSKFNDDRR